MRVALAVLLGAAAPLYGCDSGGSALIDSLPIALGRAPLGVPSGTGGNGALIVNARLPGSGAAIPMLLDTGTPITLLGGDVPPNLNTFKGDFDLVEPSGNGDAVRARFLHYDLLQLPLHPVGDGSVIPLALFGGDILRGFSVELRFGESSVTFWRHQNAEVGFLQDAGYAVLRFSLFGGGEVTAQGDSDFLGTRGPLSLPATRILLRSCVVPKPFAPQDEIVACCQRNDANTQATGANLALLMATGVGPTIIDERAWARIVTAATASGQTLTEPVLHEKSLWIATWPTPMDARWTTVPRLALVDLELGTDNDPGACVELARARRIEQVSHRTITAPELNTCVQPCDTDTRQPDKAQNSAAYLELTGDIPVAVIANDAAFLQAIRFDVRPEGPEVDGLIGAGVFGRARVELDYVSAQHRAIFSCETDPPGTDCRAAARCPRLPDHDARHVCFGLPSHGLAPTCDTSLCQ